MHITFLRVDHIAFSADYLKEVLMSVNCLNCGSPNVISRNLGRKVVGTTGAAAGAASGAAGALSGAKTGALMGAWMGPVGVTVGSLAGAVSVAWLEVRREVSPGPS